MSTENPEDLILVRRSDVAYVLNALRIFLPSAGEHEDEVARLGDAVEAP